jgi:ADP-glucose pyrophosphorylase
MQDTAVYHDAELDNCILDKEVIVRDHSRLIGPKGYPIVVGKNLTI